MHRVKQVGFRGVGYPDLQLIFIDSMFITMVDYLGKEVCSVREKIETQGKHTAKPITPR
jgi:hypothetical protein